jgi:phage terminase large subunit GpA-like protein
MTESSVPEADWTDPGISEPDDDGTVTWRPTPSIEESSSGSVPRAVGEPRTEAGRPCPSCGHENGMHFDEGRESMTCEEDSAFGLECGCRFYIEQREALARALHDTYVERTRPGGVPFDKQADLILDAFASESEPQP